MLNTTNWEFDIYNRLDQMITFNSMDISKYQDEINWCYRLGYIDELHRDQLFQYLNYRIEKTELEYKMQHIERMARIVRDQEQLKKYHADRQSIIEVFRKKG